MKPTTPLLGTLCVLLTIVLTSKYSSAQLPSIAGTVYRDTDSNGAVSGGEGIGGVALRLYADDGDGQFDTGADTFVASAMTGGDGSYGHRYYLAQSLILPAATGPGG